MTGGRGSSNFVSRSYPAWARFLGSGSSPKRPSDQISLWLKVAVICCLIFLLSGASLQWRTSNIQVDLNTKECKCSKTSQPRTFLVQKEYDVCKIACTEVHGLAFDVSEAEVIAQGLETMKRSKVHVCLLLRDASNIFVNTTRSLQSLALKFKSTHVTIIENDSADGTPNMFMDWANHVNNQQGKNRLSVQVEHHLLRFPWFTAPNMSLEGGYDAPDNVASRASRYHRMALLRNRCLLGTMQDEYDQLLVMDMDDEMNEKLTQWHGLAHSYGLQHVRGKSWDAVCANGVLPEAKWKHAYYYRNVTEEVFPFARRWVFYDSLAFRSQEFGLDTFRFHEMRIHTPYDEPFFVDSCFGGLTVYDLRNKYNKWHQCSYRAFEDDDCEHVSFHRCLRDLGWKILFNPRMVMLYTRN